MATARVMVATTTATTSEDSPFLTARAYRNAAERLTSLCLRAACDAVLVGVGTVLADDPQLPVRLVPGASLLRIGIRDDRSTGPRTAAASFRPQREAQPS